jgi:putative MFS transporter
MVTMVYIGVFCGNMISGPLADHHGRRHLILASYMGVFGFSIISSFTMSFWELCLIRLLVGFAFGIGQPPWNVLAAEVTPAKWRLVVNGASMSLFTLGEVYSALLILLDDPTMEHLDWRWLLRLGALPSLLFGAAASLFLMQSPYFLAQNGQYNEAREVISIMSRDNCLPSGFPVDFAQPRPEPLSEDDGFFSQWRKLGSAPLMTTTVIMSYMGFVLNFVYYGTLYAFPNLLPSLKYEAIPASSVGIQLLVGACWELPGIVLGCFFGMYVPRKPVMKTYCLVVFCCVLTFVMGATGGSGWFARFAWHAGYYGMKCLIQSGWIVAYMYICEVFPTSVRATGSSFIFASGRLAAIVSPLIYEKLQDWTGSFAAFFYVLATLLAINLLVVDMLPYETFNMALSNNIDEEEKEPSCTYGSSNLDQRADARVGRMSSSSTVPSPPMAWRT